MKIPLMGIFEEMLGLSKIKTKENLQNLLKDEKRLKETVRLIKEAAKKEKEAK